MPDATRIRYRQIERRDFALVADLLAKGFPSRPDPNFWLQVLHRLADRAIEGFPECGYLLECNDMPAGVILLIFSRIRTNGADEIRCNVSSWYVDPVCRPFASLFIKKVLQDPAVTYINVSPAPHTLAMLGAQGYQNYCKGQVVALPFLSRGAPGGHAAPVTPSLRPDADLSEAEVALLHDHARFGCISLVCTFEGRRYPFVFRKLRRYGLYGAIPYAHLLYCRSLDDVGPCMGILGRFLLRRGIFLAVIDADGAIPGVVGRYIQRWPKYFKGPHRPRLGDLAYTELALFDV
jgi:hypothetical protein